MTWRVLISAPYLLPLTEQLRLRLENEGIEIVTADVRERLTEESLLSLVGSIDGAICGDDPFTERVLRAASRLKVISKWGTGIDSIDRLQAERLGIRVCNTPDAFTNPVADTTLGYILCFARRLVQMDREMRQGLWIKREAVALKDCTLGLVGLGNIGQAVARRARAFQMTVIGNDPMSPPAAFLEETGVVMKPLRDLLEQADFVSLTCDLNQTSFHLIGHEQFSMMRNTAYLVNTARGSLIDEAALVIALRDGQIAGAALDVFEVEPLPADSPLRAFENCLFAPHNANSDRASRLRVHESTINNLIKALNEVGTRT